MFDVAKKAAEQSQTVQAAVQYIHRHVTGTFSSQEELTERVTPPTHAEGYEHARLNHSAISCTAEIGHSSILKPIITLQRKVPASPSAPDSNIPSTFRVRDIASATTVGDSIMFQIETIGNIFYIQPWMNDREVPEMLRFQCCRYCEIGLTGQF